MNVFNRFRVASVITTSTLRIVFGEKHNEIADTKTKKALT